MLWTQDEQSLLMRGEIALNTKSHTQWGGCVTARMYLPLEREQVWEQLTDYPRWVQYFPDITTSKVLSQGKVKQIYQAARKSFLFFTAEVEIYLSVVEVLGQQIQFHMEKGSFVDFGAMLNLEDCGHGTIIAYRVQATPTIPIPTIFIQQAMNAELPANMRRMRQVICST